MTSPNTSSPGEPFRLSREKLGLSINDVAIATKINPRILKALEEGDREGLPPHSFARGFIRSYASYLKIESQPILDAYKLNDATANPNINTDISAPKDGAAKEETSKRTLPVGNDSSLTSKALLVGGLVLIIALVVGIKNVVDKYAQERVLESDNLETTAPLLPATEATPSTEQKADIVKPAEPISAAEPVAATPIVAATTTTATPAAAAPTTASPATKIEASVATAPAVAEKAAPQKIVEEPKKAPTAVAAVPQEVILEALDTVDVTIIVDGDDTKKIKLQPESVHTIKAKASIELEIKDGGMVNIIHNGRDRGVPGDLGKPTKIKFP